MQKEYIISICYFHIKDLVSGGDSREGATPNSDIKRGVGLATQNIKMADCALLQRRTERQRRIGLANIAHNSPLPIMKSLLALRQTKIKLH
jgi:hypothetical protein